MLKKFISDIKIVFQQYRPIAVSQRSRKNSNKILKVDVQRFSRVAACGAGCRQSSAVLGDDTHRSYGTIATDDISEYPLSSHLPVT